MALGCAGEGAQGAQMSRLGARAPLAAGLLCLLLPALLQAEQLQTLPIMPGTRHETPCYIKRGDTPGKTVFIIGGMHGDERAGYLAARKLNSWVITTGTLVLIPDSHVTAIRAGQRAYPTNMNTEFPGNPRGNGVQQTAAGIWGLIKRYRPDLLVTLHESVGFHREEPRRFGQTLTYDFPELTPVFQPIIDEANRHLSVPREQFSLDVFPYPGCPTYCAGKYLGIPAVTVETCRKLPLARRIEQQLLLCAIMMYRCGLRWEGGLVWPPSDESSMPPPRAGPRSDAGE
jgi:uncharacterized protein